MLIDTMSLLQLKELFGTGVLRTNQRKVAEGCFQQPSAKS